MDDMLLMLVHPAGRGDDEKGNRVQERAHYRKLSRRLLRLTPQCFQSHRVFAHSGLSPVGFFRKVSSAHWNPPLPSFAWRDDSLILPHDGKLLCENGESTEEESIPDALKLSFAEFRATDSARETQNSQPGFISYPWTGLFLSHGRWARIVL